MRVVTRRSASPSRPGFPRGRFAAGGTSKVTRESREETTEMARSVAEQLKSEIDFSAPGFFSESILPLSGPRWWKRGSHIIIIVVVGQERSGETGNGCRVEKKGQIAVSISAPFR